jgi:hypothetical protein
MSADRGGAAAHLGYPAVSPRTMGVLRYAVGSALAMAAAMGFSWQLAYLTPILSLSFLASPAPRPGVKQGAVFVAGVAAACAAGLLLARFLLPYPMVYVPFTILLLFRVIHARSGGAAPALITLLLAAILVLPLVAMMSPEVLNQVALGLVISAFATIQMVWLAHWLFPQRALDSAPARATPAPAVLPVERFRIAMESTLIIAPVFVLFYTLRLADAVLILVFVALLSQQPGFASNYKAGLALLAGNVIGGAASLLVYELLVIAPEFPFLVLITLLCGLVFGVRVFSGRRTAPIFGMAYSTLLLVIGSTTSSGSNEAGGKVYERVLQILIAVVYVVLASGTLQRLRARRKVPA